MGSQLNSIRLITQKVGMKDLTPERVVMITSDPIIDRRILDQARSLNQSGWNVTVIANRPPTPGDRTDENAYPDVDIVRIDPFRTQSLIPLIDADKLNRVVEMFPPVPWDQILVDYAHYLLEAITRPAGIYVAHDLPQLPLAAYAAAYHDSYLVYDTHEFYGIQDRPNQALQEHFMRIEQYIAPLADLTMTVNESIAAGIAQLHKIRKPEVILNCASIEAAKLPLQKTRRLYDALSIPYNKKILLFQGFLSFGSRNIEHVISAMQHVVHEDLVFVVMGKESYPSGQKEQLIEHANSLGLLNSKVYFHDFVSTTELLDYTASADAGIIPYYGRGRASEFCSPNKLFEFLVAGIPIIASDYPVLRSFVQENSVGINRPMEQGAKQIADAINELFSQDIDALRSHCQKVSLRYNWSEQGKKLVNLYRKMINLPEQHKQLQQHLGSLIQSVQGKEFAEAETILGNMIQLVQDIKQSECA